MAEFQPCFDRTMGFEGKVLETVPDDPGGMTFWGISRKYNPLWSGWPIIDTQGPDAPILPGLVSVLYESNYWNKNSLGQFVSQQLAAQVFDAVVNLGGEAIQALQALCRINNDGVIGPISLAAINSQVESTIVNEFIQWRIVFYKNLVAENPTKQKFLPGWLSRCVLA